MIYNVLVRGLYLPPVVFEVESDNYYDAETVARDTWFKRYGHLGLRSTIISSREATSKDLKGMMEAK